MASMFRMRYPVGYNVDFFNGTGWGPARRHLDACTQALNWGADWILILGADQVYPPDLLERLMARIENGSPDGSRVEVISAMVPTRGYLGRWDMKPFQPMAWRLKSNGLSPVGWTDADKEVVRREDGDLQRIDFIGSGVLLFHRDHILSLKKPWFFETIDHETQIRTANMDAWFVWRLHAEAGAQVWCDTTIMVKHTTDMDVDESFQDRFSDYAEPGVGPSDICMEAPSTKRPVLALEA